MNADPVTKKANNLNVEEYYRVRVLRGDDYSTPIEDGPFAFRYTNAELTETSREFNKAFDNAGTKTFPGNAYEQYVKNHSIYTDVRIPGCAVPASMFVGPRRESFGIALGEVFDLVSVRSLPVDFGPLKRPTGELTNSFDGNSIDRMSVISFVLEIDQSCLKAADGTPVLGAWASVRKLEHRADYRKRNVER